MRNVWEIGSITAMSQEATNIRYLVEVETSKEEAARGTCRLRLKEGSTMDRTRRIRRSRTRLPQCGEHKVTKWDI